MNSGKLVSNDIKSIDNIVSTLLLLSLIVLRLTLSETYYISENFHFYSRSESPYSGKHVAVLVPRTLERCRLKPVFYGLPYENMI